MTAPSSSVASTTPAIERAGSLTSASQISHTPTPKINSVGK
jgi:hypothetical protein